MFTSVLPEIPKSKTPAGPILSSQSRRKSSKRVNTIRDEQSNADEEQAASSNGHGAPLTSASPSLGLIQRKSSRMSIGFPKPMRRMSTRNFGVSQARQEIPPHLVKFLQETPEQQQRLSAVKAILANEPSARNEMSLDIVYDWMLQNCKQVGRTTPKSLLRLAGGNEPPCRLTSDYLCFEQFGSTATTSLGPHLSTFAERSVVRCGS